LPDGVEDHCVAIGMALGSLYVSRRSSPCHGSRIGAKNLASSRFRIEWICCLLICGQLRYFLQNLASGRSFEMHG
jgi:hypothetical protein